MGLKMKTVTIPSLPLDSDFLARGVRSHDAALTNNNTVAAQQVIRKLEQLLADAKSKNKQAS
jgi:hypothetical protein